VKELSHHLVGVTRSHLAQYLNFTFSQGIVCVMLGHLDSDFGGNSSFAGMDDARRHRMIVYR
jgi:hypothetical protein